ncbi:tRNA lysidine(34) synthetase TilS [Macrococcoides caseolyticum]|uniref:tRNA lysidine(34) synthetase TilS n=1 Tax=Macrococcoides caseolyticum TaxID=69966 RepID=UPI001F3845A5|nr:tRNA lysidine(34) synthetase TilS [Macrococcus caseolyticus]MCE4957954.1 tRNA lysidine(34) synthetase TilS [Macrococcus caseolyticus]
MDVLWNAEASVAVAVSGGVDSMVLLDKVRHTQHFRKLYALHVNHQLRDASLEEAQMIENYCKAHDIELIVHTIPKDHFDLSRSIQEEARIIRYQFFESIIFERGIDCLLTAHHKDDQIETIFFRLLTKRYYLQPIDIQAVVDKRRYQIIRPLLHRNKSEVIAYAKKYDVPYMDDESNFENKYVRNFIRNDVFKRLDASPLEKENLLELANYMTDVNELINGHLLKFKSQINNGELSRSELLKENRLVIQRVLSELLNIHLGNYAQSYSMLDEIIRVLHSHTPHASFEITPGWHIQIAYDKLIVRNKNKMIDEYIEITSPGKYYFNEYLIEINRVDEPILIRARQAGDRIKINGDHQKVSRILKDLKIPVYDRPRVPIICTNNEVIAVGNYKKNHHPFNKDIIIKKGDINNA